MAWWKNNPLQSTIQISWTSRKIASPANQSLGACPFPTVSLLLMWWGVVSSSSVQLCLQIITQYYVCNLFWLALSTQPGDENKWIEIGECFYFHHWWQSNQTAGYPYSLNLKKAPASVANILISQEWLFQRNKRYFKFFIEDAGISYAKFFPVGRVLDWKLQNKVIMRNNGNTEVPRK